ncbi:L-threonine dehydratase catabolic TdcB isoform X1 [Diorhabda carinulata]|uniref:L-threonine dehydratase catabolic TdcB isoform X1 n=2 Tax=Diorhabda carinulata TaxID=1163345 RepID=UPI0025A08217|nr:L-threonine dehydratase catabolic TdcB isoform X1 [Diorhabda carinulata]
MENYTKSPDDSDMSDIEVEPIFEDPLCNSKLPVRVTFEEITSAAYKIRSGIVYTPCTRSHMSGLTEMDIFLKKDFLQQTGSFKERGARYALLQLTNEQKRKGVIAASLGNHAQALSYHGYQLGVPVTVVMPITAPIMKVQKCKEYNANVIMEGRNMAEAKRRAMQLAKETGWIFINGYDNPQAIAGQGTIGLEIMEQVEDIDAVVVPTGGGGLLAGVAVAVKTLNPSIKIIGVESERCASYTKAIENSEPMHTDIESTLADGLAVPQVGYNAWNTSKHLVDKMIVVKEEWIALSILRFVENEKCVVEGAGACGLAAILAGFLNEFKGKRVVLILSGGNIDTTLLGRCLDRGLAADGRLVKFKVTVSDRPGGISELCKIICSVGVSIKDIIHERAWVTSDVFSVEVKVVCETRDYTHTTELRDLLFSKYKKVQFDRIQKTDCVTSSTEI